MRTDEFIERFHTLTPPNTSAADLGCGTGENSLFLAEHGMTVDAVDCDSTPLAALRAAVDARNLKERVRIVPERIERLALGMHGAIVCTFVLHFMGPRALETLGRIQAATVPGGLNIIRSFTERGEWPSHKRRGYHLKPGELRERYAGWDILFYEEKLVKTRECDDKGNPLMQEAAGLVARKR